MTQRLSVTCHNAQQAHKAMTATIWPMLKAMVTANHRMVLELRPASKSRDQEQKYHAMVGEVAGQAKHLGSTWSAEDWKRLLLDKFARETGRSHGQVIPNLDKTGVVEVGLLSRKFSKADASEFIEWLHAWGVENGVTYSDQFFIDQETGGILK